MTPTYWYIAGIITGMAVMKLIDKLVEAICEAWKY